MMFADLALAVDLVVKLGSDKEGAMTFADLELAVDLVVKLGPDKAALVAAWLDNAADSDRPPTAAMLAHALRASIPYGMAREP